MKTIINDKFMLNSKTAIELYENFAKDMPIIDYHCHLDPKMIALDHRFSDVGELMLGGDHYKWRAMRSFGIEEKYMTGDASGREKFRAFAKMIPFAIGNPLYHWTHLELKRYFDIDEPLTEESADRIFDRCNELLASDGYTARGLVERSGVEVICTTDDPADSLEWHKMIRESGFSTKVLPTFRPDKAVAIQKDTFLPYIKSIGVKNYEDLKAWLADRIAFFHQNGCRIADHGLDFMPYAEGDASAVFASVLGGNKPTDKEIQVYMTDLIIFCGKEYAKRGWCMQIHVGATRNNNTAMYRALGADTGYDAIGDSELAVPLSKLMDAMELEDLLPKTILYSLNPNDTYTLATLMGAFQKAPFRSKIQLGSGWWFNDQRDGMEAQLRAYGNLGILGCFVGMLTDSRSFISYPRHEYFRRILCNLVGSWVENGEYPDDRETLGKIIRGICYENAKDYFNF
jgi:glucuronate isomerase